LGWPHRYQGLAYASSVQARQTNFTAATDSADWSTNTPEQHDGWFCVPDRREAIFWQTQKTARAANPGGRIPRRRSLTGPVAITVDTRERYAYRFTQQPVETVRATVPAGDYAVQSPDGTILAAVERKSLDNLAATLSDGTLAFQMQRLAELPLAAVVVEARYSALYKLEHVDGNWLADQLARLEVRYPEVHLVFADSSRYAEDWTYRFLTTALTDTTDPDPNSDWHRLTRGLTSSRAQPQLGIYDPYRVRPAASDHVVVPAQQRHRRDQKRLPAWARQ
jgi:hypothetical protein